jgi:hypothetical protein
MYLCGGGIVSHPGGAGAGVKAVRQAWEAAVAGIPLEAYAKDHGTGPVDCRLCRGQGRMKRLISYYGDDFTGSTDVMESLAIHGVKTVLFTRQPTAEEFAPYADYHAFGLAGTSRSETPEWMDEHLPAVFRWLKSLNARYCHYKVCSTFDSSRHMSAASAAPPTSAPPFSARP